MAAALVLLAALTAAAIAARKKHPYLLVGWLWYLVSVTPVLGIVPLGLASRADRDTYLSQIGLYLAAAMFTANLAARRRWGPRVWPAATLAVTVLLPLRPATDLVRAIASTCGRRAGLHFRQLCRL